MTTYSADAAASSSAARITLFAAIKAAVTGDIIAAITAAIHKIDPSAQILASPPGNVLTVETLAPAQAVREAIQNAGYIADISATRPRGERAFSFGRLIGQTLLWLAIGTVAVPLFTLLALLVLRLFDPVCGTPGDSGGCEMGMAAITLGAIPVGAVLGLLLGIYRGLR